VPHLRCLPGYWAPATPALTTGLAAATSGPGQGSPCLAGLCAGDGQGAR
jgi:hypothetical protein